MEPAFDPHVLERFLGHPSRPAGTLRYHELKGFLFSVVSAPELIPPSEWLPIIFGDEEAGYTTLAEAKEVMGQIMALYNTINAAVLDPPTLLPGDCPLRHDVLANFADEAPIAQWSRGFLHGYQWLEELWDVELPEEVDEEFHATFMALTFFASQQTAENFVAETEEHSLDTLAEAMVQVFPEAVASFVRIGRSIHEILAARRGSIRTRSYQQDRTKRSLSMWKREEVQEMLWGDRALNVPSSKQDAVYVVETPQLDRGAEGTRPFGTAGSSRTVSVPCGNIARWNSITRLSRRSTKKPRRQWPLGHGFCDPLIDGLSMQSSSVSSLAVSRAHREC